MTAPTIRHDRDVSQRDIVASMQRAPWLWLATLFALGACTNRSPAIIPPPHDTPRPKEAPIADASHRFSCAQLPGVTFSLPVLPSGWTLLRVEPYQDLGCRIVFSGPPSVKFEVAPQVYVVRMPDYRADRRTEDLVTGRTFTDASGLRCFGGGRNPSGIPFCRAFDPSRWVTGYEPALDQWDYLQFYGQLGVRLILESLGEEHGFSREAFVREVIKTYHELGSNNQGVGSWRHQATQVAQAASDYAQAHRLSTIYLVTAGSGGDPNLLDQVLVDLRREIEEQLAAKGLTVARNVAPAAQRPPPGSPAHGPVPQPEQIEPAPDLILFVAVDLVARPRKLTSWLVSPADYRRKGVYANPQQKQVREL
jgi:hypothetical protein